MRSLKLTVAYIGDNYVGWQVQPNGPSIQAELEAAWTKVNQESIRITASGRTDAGVHALEQVCSLETGTDKPPETIRRALNAHTPFDIEVIAIDEAPDGFHAIRAAIEKTYSYRINWGQPRDIFQMGRSWYVPQQLDVDAMIKAASSLVGEHDFVSFASAKITVRTTVRTVSRIEVESRDVGPYRNLHVRISANGFLYNMVRKIVGSLVEVGYGLQPPSWTGRVLNGRDPQLAGMTAPACGLYLENVRYE